MIAPFAARAKAKYEQEIVQTVRRFLEFCEEHRRGIPKSLRLYLNRLKRAPYKRTLGMTPEPNRGPDSGVALSPKCVAMFLGDQNYLSTDEIDLYRDARIANTDVAMMHADLFGNMDPRVHQFAYRDGARQLRNWWAGRDPPRCVIIPVNIPGIGWLWLLL